MRPGKPWIAAAGIAAVLVIVASVAFFAWPAPLPPVSASAGQPTGDALIARGAYLTRAADCVACHTAPGGRAFAGGRAFDLPFGTIYSPNITPDQDTGIGAWSDATFVRALQRGVGRDGENLYPAFPYTAYARLSMDDALAIRAYLATLRPVQSIVPANQIAFPFNQRYFVRAWDLLYRPSRPQSPDPTRDEAWNRGAYLVNALGHCGECHTPRTRLMGLDGGRDFAGAEQAGWLAYNLTSDGQHGLGAWTDAQLEQYLATGQAEGRGPASGPMAEVIENSLRYLGADDIRSIVHYLRSVSPQSEGPAAVRIGAPITTSDPLGARLFAQACAGCHLPNGDGRQSRWAALQGSHTAGDPAATNLLRVLAQGTQIHTGQGVMFMHGFTSAYTDEELAALANYTAGQFGHHHGTVTAEQVRRLRATQDSSPKS